jgi:formylglycine-generating enzyme required for sulfatase activity
MTFHKLDKIQVTNSLKLPEGLRLAGRDVSAADGRQVPLYLFRLPDGSDMEMVAVPAGDFVMGADDSDAPDWEKPRHNHPMEHSYWIGRNDVTRGQFKTLCAATGRAEPEKTYFDDQLGGDKDRHPVIMVSWDDAKAYCAWTGLVLPSEAEWEKAARGADGRKYPWGIDWDPTKANYLDASCPGDKIMMGNGKTLEEHMAQFGGRDLDHNDGFPYTSPVGSFPTGVSPYGALDMAGNVFNWCEDWWDETGFPRTTQGDFSPPQGGSWRVDRGSSWGNPGRLACRTSMRYGYAPSDSNEHLGFRVLLRP